jgi:chemotaxis protein MotA
LGFACIIITILIPGATLGDYVDIPSIFIVVGGVVASTVVAYPQKTLKNLIKVMSNAFKAKKIDLQNDIDMIINVANVARRESILAIEDSVRAFNDPFFLKGAMLVVDAVDPELVREVMEMELSYIKDRHSSSQSVILQMSSFSPAYGMIGTLIGLINMLGSLTDMDSLGPNMAVALVTTFYGVILANLVFTPIAKKLKMMGDEEVLRDELLLEGILAIQAGENPTLIRERLNAFLPHSSLDKRGGASS